MYVEYNPNPDRKLVDDCVIRAICKITNKDWEQVYTELMVEGLEVHDWPMKNYVWGRYLSNNDFTKHLLPDTCPFCYTTKHFCNDHPIGSYILATGTHVIAVVNGDYYDTWDSGDEVPVYYWKRKETYTP